MRGALAGTAVPFVVNDRADVALAGGAHGIHVGREDLDPADARRLLGPDAIVGVTVHKDAEADDVDPAVADYAGIGPVFASGTKPDNDPPIGPDGLAALVARLHRRLGAFPTCGISGIDDANAAPVIAAGADGVAVIGALFMADDVAAAATRLRATVDRALAARAPR